MTGSSRSSRPLVGSAWQTLRDYNRPSRAAKPSLGRCRAWPWRGILERSGISPVSAPGCAGPNESQPWQPERGRAAAAVGRRSTTRTGRASGCRAWASATPSAGSATSPTWPGSGCRTPTARGVRRAARPAPAPLPRPRHGADEPRALPRAPAAGPDATLARPGRARPAPPRSLVQLFSTSQYFSELMIRDPALLDWLRAGGRAAAIASALDRRALGRAPRGRSRRGGRAARHPPVPPARDAADRLRRHRPRAARWK